MASRPLVRLLPWNKRSFLRCLRGLLVFTAIHAVLIVEVHLMAHLPTDLERIIEKAWQRAQAVPDFMAENEMCFLATAAACAPADGVILEIGSFKGKPTVGLATVCEEYGLAPVVAIDPHVGDFPGSLKSAGVEQHVEFHRAPSREVATNWNRAIRLLWIYGDQSYQGCKEDFDLVLSSLVGWGNCCLPRYVESA